MKTKSVPVRFLLIYGVEVLKIGRYLYFMNYGLPFSGENRL